MTLSRHVVGLCCAATAIVVLVVIYSHNRTYRHLVRLEENQKNLLALAETMQREQAHQLARLEESQKNMLALAEAMQREQNRQFARLDDTSKSLLAFASTPILANLEMETLGGVRLKTIKYSLISSPELDTMRKRRCPRDLMLPFPQYKDRLRTVEFQPWQWSVNVSQLCACAEAKGLPRVKRLLDQMLTQIEPFSVESAPPASYTPASAPATDSPGALTVEFGPALFYTYPFDYPAKVAGGRVLKKGWVSGLAQGAVLAAWVRLYRVTNDPKHLEMAEKTFNSFLLVRREMGQEEPWVSFVDENQYLWFEEFPTDQDPQFRVLNGHIYALKGLYSYYLLAPNEECLKLLRAGITTVKRYFNDFRSPGRPNRYCLVGDYVPDYGPARSIEDQEWLHRITGDPFFLEAAAAFKTDMKF